MVNVKRVLGLVRRRQPQQAEGVPELRLGRQRLPWKQRNETEMDVRNEQACTAWSIWMPCSVTCGNGYELYRRDCNEGVEGDIGCEGSRVEYRECGNTVSLNMIVITFFCGNTKLWKTMLCKVFFNL